MRRYWILSGFITLGMVFLGVFVFAPSYIRLVESIADLFLSLRYYFSTVFCLDFTGAIGVNIPSKVLEWNVNFPTDFDGFVAGGKEYFSLLFNGENFRSWWYSFLYGLFDFFWILSIIIPIIILLVIFFKWRYGSHNTEHGKDTVPLRVFKRLSTVIYQPIKRFIRGYIDFLRTNAWIWKLWLWMLVFHLNLPSIVIELLAYYLYVAMSYDFSTFFLQFSKLFIDLQMVFRIPFWVWLLLIYPLFNRWRKKIARGRLRRYEARNCGFINELPIVSLTCGSMGKKKTTMITDMVLSQEVMFRQKALEILQKADMKFPYFPWIKFEDDLRNCMRYHTVYNLATIKTWVALKRERYTRHGDEQKRLYGYRISRYGRAFCDELREYDLFDVLEIYAQAYFIYVIESSIIVSNYSVRTGAVLYDEGNFPAWDNDFFAEGVTEGRHAHVLDFDVLRLGRKLVEENPNIGSFEFGVVAITEVGKERGNNLELQELKKRAEETNQKNDLFNAWLKMCRHSATVDNFPFIKVFADEQRPESWGADARDLCDVIHIVSTSEEKLAMPFYTIEEMISEWVFNRFLNLYTDMRFRRGDNTLLVHIFKTVSAWLWRRNLRIHNKYGYTLLRIEKERGTMDSKPEKKKYYLMSKKIYARRFTTDCFSDYFNELASRTHVGLNDYLEYLTERASVEELKEQNSYFIRSLYGK